MRHDETDEDTGRGWELMAERGREALFGGHSPDMNPLLDRPLSPDPRESRYTKDERKAIRTWLESGRSLFIAEAAYSALRAVGDSLGEAFAEETWADYAARRVDHWLRHWDPSRPRQPRCSSRGFVQYIIGQFPLFGRRQPEDEVQMTLIRKPSGLRAYAWHAAKRRLRDATPDVIDLSSSTTEDADVETSIWAAVSTLDDRHRIAVELRYLRGFESLQSAVVLGTSYGAYKTQLCQARSKLLPLIRVSGAQDLALAHFLNRRSLDQLRARIGGQFDHPFLAGLVEEGRQIIFRKLLLAKRRGVSRPEDQRWLAVLASSPLALVVLSAGASPDSLAAAWSELTRRAPGLKGEFAEAPSSSVLQAHLAEVYARVARERLEAGLREDPPLASQVPRPLRAAHDEVFERPPSTELVARSWLALGLPRLRLAGAFPGHERLLQRVLTSHECSSRANLLLTAYLLGCELRQLSETTGCPEQQLEEIVAREAAAALEGGDAHVLFRQWPSLAAAFDLVRTAIGHGPWPFALPELPGNRPRDSEKPREALSRLLRIRNGKLTEYWA
jgi:hypothetical protein